MFFKTLLVKFFSGTYSQSSCLAFFLHSIWKVLYIVLWPSGILCGMYSPSCDTQTAFDVGDDAGGCEERDIEEEKKEKPGMLT